MTDRARARARIAVVDSGIDPAHPGVRGHAVAAGFHVSADGAVRGESPRDPLGHGTAVAATVLDLCPTAELLAVRIFDGVGHGSPRALAAALRALLTRDVAFVNVSLGFEVPFAADGALPRDLDELASAAAALVANGVRLIAPFALPDGRANALATVPGLDLVVADANVPRRQPTCRRIDGRIVWFASPVPPDGIPGLPPARIRGSSLAVARVTGSLAGAS